VHPMGWKLLIESGLVFIVVMEVVFHLLTGA
jgi:hypothetical protein